MDLLADWISLIDARYPERDAEDWDATGLQVGDPDQRVERVLVCLDVTPETLDEAERLGAHLVLAHHPLLFRPLERLTCATAPGRLALRAARAGIAVLAAHTNFDVAVPGTSDPLVELLGLAHVRPLRPGAGEERVKLVTFVPPEHTDTVIEGLARAGAGVIGEYNECSFRSAGIGTFRPSASANPVLGEREQRNEVAEDRVEVVLPRARLRAVVEALHAGHPYEEVAYDVYPLVDVPSGKGLGRVGQLPDPVPLRVLADRLVAGLPSPHLRVVGDLDGRVARVAVCGGAGESLIGAALRAGADLFVTGDLRHHVALDARTMGLSLIDAGHYATEAAALPRLVADLQQAAAAQRLTARVLLSTVPTEPWAPYAAHETLK